MADEVISEMPFYSVADDRRLGRAQFIQLRKQLARLKRALKGSKAGGRFACS
jgi:hypothetical protein